MTGVATASLRQATPATASDPRAALTRCAWILADEGHESGLAGQLTARGPRDGTFWTLPLGLAFDEAEEASWLLIDDALNVLEGAGSFGIREPNPATRFHLWVYRARADVQAIVHTHPPAASALAAAAQPLVVAHMDATPLFDDIAFLPDWPGLPTADREGELIAAALGTKHALLLAHHGLLAAGRGVAGGDLPRRLHRAHGAPADRRRRRSAAPRRSMAARRGARAISCAPTGS